MIPTSILVNQLFPFLDRATWNSFAAVSKDVFRSSRQQIPPWPTDRLILSKKAVKDDVISPIAFDQTGTRLAVLAHDDSINIYDRRRGHIKTIEVPNIVVERIYFLDVETILLMTIMGVIKWQLEDLDEQINGIHVLDFQLRNVDSYRFSQGLLYCSNLQLIISGRGISYLLATSHHVVGNDIGKIRIQLCKGSGSESESESEPDVHFWLEHPVPGDVKYLQCVSSSEPSKPLFLVSISEDRDVYMWRLDGGFDISEYGIASVIPISCGKISAHSWPQHNRSHHRFVVSISPNRGGKLRITEIREDLMDYDSDFECYCEDDTGECNCQWDDEDENHDDDYNNENDTMGRLECLRLDRQVNIWEQNKNDNMFLRVAAFTTGRRDINAAVSDDGCRLVTFTKDWSLDVRRLDNSEKLGAKPKSIAGCRHFDGCRPDGGYSFRSTNIGEPGFLVSDVGVHLSGDSKVAVTSCHRELRIHYL